MVAAARHGLEHLDRPDPRRADSGLSLLKPEEFFDVNNARNIATDAAVLLVLAVGLTT